MCCRRIRGDVSNYCETGYSRVNIMELLPQLIQVAVALTVINVWTIRFNQETSWRGGNAKNMCEEFNVYGLSPRFRQAVCLLKLSGSLLLIVGLWCKQCTLWGALLLSLLMAGAVVMHIKVKDPVKKSIPAAIILLLCLYLITTYQG